VKITNLSLAAIAVVGMMSVASADVDMKIGGQAVVYYQTAESGGDTDFFDKGNSKANAGLQLNANSDIGNGFGLGLQGTALSTWGLEKNLVTGVMQSGLGNNGDTANSSDYFAITKAYLTKKLGNTTLKMGRQELPKSLSPLAFSEGWNVYKNTFDAVVAINSDIPDTTVVGAYVSRSNQHGNLNTFDDLHAKTSLDLDGDGKKGDSVGVEKGAYMLTVANKSLKQAPITLSYYHMGLGAVGTADAVWADVQVDAGIPVKFGLQGGMIMPDIGNMDDTQAAGVKVNGKAGPVALQLAYSKVGGAPIALKNVGTGVKTPLYTQMILNQNHISRSADTVVLKGVMPVGPGKVIAQYGATTDNQKDGSDYNELDVIYKFKALGTTMLAAYVMADHDEAKDPTNIIRVWTRYNF